MLKPAIVGLGHVGSLVRRVFPDALAYDKYQPCPNSREELATADLVFITVPAPTRHDRSVDLTEVRDALTIGRSDAIRVLKSTVPPGTTAALRDETSRRIVHSPEFIGEWEYPGWVHEGDQWPYVIVGGEQADIELVLEAYAERMGAHASYFATDSTTAEFVKYMENAWLAAQVTFANEFYDLAQACGVNYWAARELWSEDPRVSKTHTVVRRWERGFGGRCLPKDVDAILGVAAAMSVAMPMLSSVSDSNHRRRGTP